MKPKRYLETSVPSYYTSRLSRDVVVLAHQEVTRLWWERRLPLFDTYISELVLDEVGRGDPYAARRRLDALTDFLVLKTTPDIEDLATPYVTKRRSRSLTTTAKREVLGGGRPDVLTTLVEAWEAKHDPLDEPDPLAEIRCLK